MNAFEEARLASFLDVLLVRTRQVHSVATAFMDDETLIGVLERSVRTARALGLKRRSELERFADLTIALNPGFETTEAWAREIFARDNMHPAEKLSDVEGCAVFIIRGNSS